MASKPSIILGISYGHGDSSAALIVNGCLVAAVEEERFTRIKHFALFPKHAIRYCLLHASVDASDISVVSIARKPLNQFLKRCMSVWRYPALLRARKNDRRADASLNSHLHELGITRAKVQRVEHHLAHLMSARLLTSSYDMALLSFDGLGDFVSTAIGRPQGHGVEIVERVLFPHSLGHFYNAMTQYLGFPHFGDEFKVMGLSSYGKPRFVEELKKIIIEDTTGFGFKLNLEAFPIEKMAEAFLVENGQPVVSPFYQKNILTQMFGVAPRKAAQPLGEIHYDLAKSVQVRFEQIANHLLLQLHSRIKSNTLGLAGGCAHNSVWVGKIPECTPFRNVLVAPASNDAGIAVGAAAIGANQDIKVENNHWALLGPSHNESCGDLPPTNIGAITPLEKVKHTEYSNEEKLLDWMVSELCQGKILGLCHGRMEFGPRALGSRSILADPRVATMKDKLNARVKHREKFRPFAASVQWEYQHEWFPRSFFSPAMEAVFPVINPQKVPAVAHVDQTCRIQSVTKEQQPFYWSLIEKFREKTGVPMLLNTSFNDSEPIVCSHEDALRCFCETEMDGLVIGHTAYYK